MCTSDLDAMVTVCLKGLEGSNYDVRVKVAQLLGVLMAGSQQPQPANTKTKKISTEDMFGMMTSAFLKGGIGFLKPGGIMESGKINLLSVEKVVTPFLVGLVLVCSSSSA